jgi:glycosyltransferase involved in cell wall biosynthesis
MKNIVFISANEHVPWGGSEHCWSAAAERFAQRGVQVHVSVMDWGKPVKQVEHLRSIGCRIFLRARRSLPERIKRKFLLGNQYESHHLKKIAARADLLVISQGGNMDGFPWMRAAKSMGYAYASIAEGVPNPGWPEDDAIAQFADAYEGGCAAFFVSEANLALTRRQFATPLSKARVLRNPFNVRYDACPPWPNGDADELRLAYVARLDVGGKRQDLICDVMSLPQWRSRNVSVSFIGDGPNERALRRYVEKLKLASVRFEGFVSDIEELWSKYHAQVFSSNNEGMPLSVVEAMLCGRACIATDVGGNRELIRDGINGFIAKAPTMELLDEAMNRAWENRHRLREMGEAAGRDVRQWVSADPTGDFVRELDSLVQPDSVSQRTGGQ